LGRLRGDSVSQRKRIRDSDFRIRGTRTDFDTLGKIQQIPGTPVREEDFTLDPTGNWADYLQKTSGSTDLDQDRTHNEVNETTDITETTGPAWVTPVHDRAGNMTTAPNPSSLTTALTCKYDAWNRLVEAGIPGIPGTRTDIDTLGKIQ
jgi:hypothetical protein